MWLHVLHVSTVQMELEPSLPSLHTDKARLELPALVYRYRCAILRSRSTGIVSLWQSMLSLHVYRGGGLPGVFRYVYRAGGRVWPILFRVVNKFNGENAIVWCTWGVKEVVAGPLIRTYTTKNHFDFDKICSRTWYTKRKSLIHKKSQE